MSSPSNCCQTCDTPSVVNTPGPQGEAGNNGTNGTNGVDAFTQTTADFAVPLIGANVTVSVVNSDWMVVGQVVVASGPANFLVASKPTSTSTILTFLGYTGDVAPATNIATGATISPGGLQGPNNTLLPATTSYAVGGSQALTNSLAQLLAASITIPAAGTYLLLATVRLDFVACTFAATQTVTAKLRATVLGAYISDAVVSAETGTPTTITSTFAVLALPPVTFAANQNEVIQLFGTVAAAPGAGALNAVEVSILALKLF